MPPRQSAENKHAAHALARFLRALGVRLDGDLRQTPARAARLWREHLLAGQGLDPAQVLGRGSASSSRAAVSLRGVGVHLVCPHHLTVAFGEAHLAYLPAGRLAGFGALIRLVRACTARLVLQEEATQRIADALTHGLDARAAVAMIDARHPCHAVAYGASHRARAVTWAQAGVAKDAAALRNLLRSSS
ncbi:MAG: GTP cyclohydrolase I [Deltaproteobacteria bacterium]|nr:GTP cyclohydrolase I [Deltaproteobacteria bacterium]